MDAALAHRVGRKVGHAIGSLFDAPRPLRIYSARELLETPSEKLEAEGRAWTRAYRNWKRHEQTRHPPAPHPNHRAPLRRPAEHPGGRRPPVRTATLADPG